MKALALPCGCRCREGIVASTSAQKTSEARKDFCCQVQTIDCSHRMLGMLEPLNANQAVYLKRHFQTVAGRFFDLLAELFASLALGAKLDAEL